MRSVLTILWVSLAVSCLHAPIVATESKRPPVEYWSASAIARATHRLDPTLNELRVKIIAPQEQADAANPSTGVAVATEGPCPIVSVSFWVSQHETILTVPPWFVALPRGTAQTDHSSWHVEVVDACGHGVLQKVVAFECDP